LRCLRSGNRFQVELPVEVEWRSGSGKLRRLVGEIVNMSSHDVLMHLPSRLRPNTPITFTVSLPQEVTKVPLRLRCRARVVRREDGTLLPFGVVAIIDHYRFLRGPRPVSRPLKPRYPSLAAATAR
jgi:hypothetical protein